MICCGNAANYNAQGAFATILFKLTIYKLKSKPAHIDGSMTNLSIAGSEIFYKIVDLKCPHKLTKNRI